ncbi:hypothetical protein ACWDQO_37080 [Streptomyces sp. NPDC003703]
MTSLTVYWVLDASHDVLLATAVAVLVTDTYPSPRGARTSARGPDGPGRTPTGSSAPRQEVPGE